MTSKPKIMIVDDDDAILDLLHYNLQKEGYSVRTVSESSEALGIAGQFLPDLVVLDLMMPSINGIDICRQLRINRSFRDLYIFFLTAKSEAYYRHAVYEVGGDDFIEKIIGLKPLICKIRSVLKRKYVIRKGQSRLCDGSLELVRSGGAVYYEGRRITLNSSEFEILFFLAQNKGRSIPVSELIHSLWGSDLFIDENSVRRFLGNLKQKLGERLIRTDRHDGYQLGKG